MINSDYAKVVYQALRGYAFNEPEIRWLSRFVPRGATVVDVGANSGSYTWWLARRAGRCLAFEPNPRLAQRLRTLGRHVEVFDIALADSKGTAQLFIPVHSETGRELSGLAALESRKETGAEKAIEVAVHRLDDFDLDDLALIKIDVEGFEQEVIRGAADTIQAHQPIVIVEAEERHRTGAVSGVFAWFEAAGYAGFWLRDKDWASVDAFEIARDQNTANLDPVFGRKLGPYHNNFVFLPPSKLRLLGMA